MPTYGRPGVYVNETLTPLVNTFSAPGETAAAFVGTHPQGPTDPTQIQSWTQFVKQFGGFAGQSTLAYAVYQYFTNGGRDCYVVRAAASDADVATVSLADREGTPEPVLRVDAANVGAWANGLSIGITDSGLAGSGRFDLYVYLGGTTPDKVVERWVDLSMNPADNRYAPSLVNNASTSGSAYIRVANLVTSGTPYSVNQTPAVTGAPEALSGGVDGTATVDRLASVQKLGGLGVNVALNLPGISDANTLNPIIAYAETTGALFIVADTPSANAGDTSTQTATAFTAMATGGGALTPSSVVAVYGPWLSIADPATTSAGMKDVPAGGAVLGTFAQTDATRGVQKPPAGISAKVNCLQPQVRFTDSDLNNLNAAGINVLRPVPGQGICIMGSRTLSSGYPDRYVNVRRTLMYLKKSLVDGTQWVLFEDNNEALWATIVSSLEQWLTSLMQVGVLKGSTPQAAFYVICDASNNTEQTVLNGEVHISVGVALNTPAEFVVIDIVQFEGASSATTSA